MGRCYTGMPGARCYAAPPINAFLNTLLAGVGMPKKLNRLIGNAAWQLPARTHFNEWASRAIGAVASCCRLALRARRIREDIAEKSGAAVILWSQLGYSEGNRVARDLILA